MTALQIPHEPLLRGGHTEAAPVEVELEWSRLFEAGGFVDPAAEPGERVALRISRAIVAKLLPGLQVHVREVLFTGPVLVTDARVAVMGPAIVDRRGVIGPEPVQWEFRWADVRVRDVLPLPEGGVSVVPTEAAIAEGGRMWGIVTPGLVSEPPALLAQRMAGFRMWNRVAGAYAASKGDLEGWRARTSELLGRAT